MNDLEHIQELTAEVDDLTRQLRSAGAEIGRLREQLRGATEDNQRLRREMSVLAARLSGTSPAAVVSAPEPEAPRSAEYQQLVREVNEAKARLVAPKPATDVCPDAVALRKKRLADEIERARQTISQAALIKQQMAELEKVTQMLSDENERLRTTAPEATQTPVASDLPAVTLLPAPRQMIKPLLPPATPAALAARAREQEEAESKLRVMPPVAPTTGTTAHDMSGRRMVFLNSLFGRKKDGDK